MDKPTYLLIFMLRKHLSLLVASIVIPLGAVNAETFNLSLSVGGNATFFPEASKGFLVADTEGDGFEFLGSNSSYLLFGANASASGTLWGTNDVVVLAGLSTEVFPEVGRGFNASTVAFNSASLSQNWTSGDKFMLVWFPTGVSQDGSGYSYYRSEDKGNGTISFETPKQGASDDIVAVGISPTASGSIALSASDLTILKRFKQIFLRDADQDEFLDYRKHFKPIGNLTESEIIVKMLKSDEFMKNDFPIYALHYWAERAPADTTEEKIITAINYVSGNYTVLNNWSSFSFVYENVKIPPAPYGATVGQSQAAQYLINELNIKKIPSGESIKNLVDSDLLEYCLSSYDPSPFTDVQKTQILTYMKNHSPQNERQGALAAFLSNLATEAVDGSKDKILARAAGWLIKKNWNTSEALTVGYVNGLVASSGGGGASSGGGGAPPAKSKKGKGARKSSASKAANSKSKSSSGGSAKKSGRGSVKKSGGKKSKKK